MRFIQQTLLAIALSTAVSTSVRAQSKVEYFWDTDPGVGKGQVLQSFTGSGTVATAELDVGALSTGIHTLGLRALNNTWFSATYHRSFFIPAEEEKITCIEYSWDTDKAVGKGTALSFTEGSTVDLSKQLSVTGLTTGMHTLYLRALSTHQHSLTYTRSFFVPATPHAVNAIEYFFDTDPGVGKATRMAASIEGESLTKAFDVETDGLADGVHHIGIRTLTDGTWSATYVRQFLVRTLVEDYVTQVEYYWNNDPGYGQGFVVDITPGKEVNVDFEADMTDLPEGPHTLGIRAQSGSLGWSATSLVEGIEFEGWDNLQDYLNSLRDTEDNFAANTYGRQFLNKDWQTLYVPFSLTYNDWADHFDVARINAFYQYDDDEDGVVDRQVLEAIIVRPGNGRLKPNYPYLIRAKQKGNYTLPVSASRTEAQAINSVSCSTLEAKYTFTGNYSDLSGLKSASRYRLRGGSLSIPDDDDEVLPPFRWYLTIDDLGNQLEESAAKIRVRILDDDTLTGIDDQLTLDDNETVGNRTVYDLSGRPVAISPDTPLTSLPKGVYIINNKKYIAK